MTELITVYLCRYFSYPGEVFEKTFSTKEAAKKFNTTVSGEVIEVQVEPSDIKYWIGIL